MQKVTLFRRIDISPDAALALITDLKRLPASVTWRLLPQTFWRRALLARIRQRQLRRTEVPASLTALQAALQHA